MSVNFAYKFLFHTVGIFNMPLNFSTWAHGFISPPKEVVLRILIAIKNPSSSTGFEHAYLGSNGKHGNH
jgi:hypothetical protein